MGFLDFIQEVLDPNVVSDYNYLKPYHMTGIFFKVNISFYLMTSALQAEVWKMNVRD